MNKMLKIAVFSLFLFGSITTLAAQKFGYVNSAAILAELPAVRAAEADLEALQKQLQKRGQDMVQQFQADVKVLEDKVAAGTMSPQEQQTEGGKLQKRQEEIGKFEQDMRSQLENKRNGLLEPIYDKVNVAIESIAKEQGYQLIFDQQVLLYGEEVLDVTAAVKTKLGM